MCRGHLRGKPSEGVLTVLLRGKPGRYKSSHVLAMLAVPSTVHYSSTSSSNGRSTAKNKKTETKDELVPFTNDTPRFWLEARLCLKERMPPIRDIYSESLNSFGEK